MYSKYSQLLRIIFNENLWILTFFRIGSNNTYDILRFWQLLFNLPSGGLHARLPISAIKETLHFCVFLILLLEVNHLQSWPGIFLTWNKKSQSHIYNRGNHLNATINIAAVLIETRNESTEWLDDVDRFNLISLGETVRI